MGIRVVIPAISEEEKIRGLRDFLLLPQPTRWASLEMSNRKGGGLLDNDMAKLYDITGDLVWDKLSQGGLKFLVYYER